MLRGGGGPVLDRIAELVNIAIHRYKTPGHEAVINSSESRASSISMPGEHGN